MLPVRLLRIALAFALGVVWFGATSFVIRAPSPPPLPSLSPPPTVTAPPTAAAAAVTAPPTAPVRAAPRVLCFVPSRLQGGYFLERIIKVWLSKCDEYVITSTGSNATLHVAEVNTTKGQGDWNIIHPGWLHVAEHYLEAYDWFIKVDDDSYLILDNLRGFVQNMDPEEEHYFGNTLYAWADRTGWMTKYSYVAGGGYVVSRASLRKLAPFLPDYNPPPPPLPQTQTPSLGNATQQEKCPRYVIYEDLGFAWCLRVSGWREGEPDLARDQWGREHVAHLKLDVQLQQVNTAENKPPYYYGKNASVVNHALNSISSRPFGTHGYKPPQPKNYMKNDLGQLIPTDFMFNSVAVDPI